MGTQIYIRWRYLTAIMNFGKFPFWWKNWILTKHFHYSEENIFKFDILVLLQMSILISKFRFGRQISLVLKNVSSDLFTFIPKKFNNKSLNKQVRKYQPILSDRCKPSANVCLLKQILNCVMIIKMLTLYWVGTEGEWLYFVFLIWPKLDINITSC